MTGTIVTHVEAAPRVSVEGIRNGEAVEVRWRGWPMAMPSMWSMRYDLSYAGHVHASIQETTRCLKPQEAAEARMIELLEAFPEIAERRIATEEAAEAAMYAALAQVSSGARN